MNRIATCCLTALVALLALLSLGCGGSPTPSPSPSAPSGVRGTVVVYLMGGEAPQPNAAVAVYAGSTQDQIVAKDRTDSDGAFSFDLAPGTYTVAWRYATPQTVTVTPGRYEELEFTLAGK